MKDNLIKNQNKDLIINCLKKNSRLNLREISEQTGLNINIVKGYITFIKKNYNFTIIKKDSIFYDYLKLHGWFEDKELKKV